MWEPMNFTEPSIPDDEALDYAIAHIKDLPEDEKTEFVEWFFSGAYIYREEGEDPYGQGKRI